MFGKVRMHFFFVLINTFTIKQIASLIPCDCRKYTCDMCVYTISIDFTKKKTLTIFKVTQYKTMEGKFNSMF